MLGNVSFCREFLPLSSPNEINFMIIYLFYQKIYSFTAVLNPQQQADATAINVVFYHID